MNDHRTFADIIYLIVHLFNLILPILAGVAVLVFFWGLVLFIAKSGDATSHTEGRKFMVWGIIGIFVMVSFLGIINFFYTDLGLDTKGPLGIPSLPTNH